MKFPSEYPFKDQRSANKLPEQPSDLSQKINTEVHSVFTSHGIKDELKAKEPKPPIVNQQKPTKADTYINAWRNINDR